MLRLSLAAALLLTAAGVLYADPADPADHADPAAPAPAPGAEDRLPIPDGLVGVPVTLDEPTALTVLRAGDRVDLLAVPDPDAAGPAALASGAAVLAVDLAAAAVLLALTPGQADDVVSVPAGTRFAVIVRS